MENDARHAHGWRQLLRLYAGVGSPRCVVRLHPSIASIERDYWYAGNESFATVAQRYADQMGLTFKVQGNQAVFTHEAWPYPPPVRGLGLSTPLSGRTSLAGRCRRFTIAWIRWLDFAIV